jgi:hypothetical protein
MSRQWWGQKSSDPKRRYRFLVSMGGTDIPVWTIKTAAKPKANVSTVEHMFLDYTFKYPGRVTWDNISMTLVDPVDPDLASAFIKRLLESGYAYPKDPNVSRTSISKKKAIEALGGDILIQQIDAEGNPIDTWSLKNAYIVSIDFGGTLDYTSDEMNEITVEVSFDWAEYESGVRGGSINI